MLEKDGVPYYPVEYCPLTGKKNKKTRRFRIIGLPPGEDPNDYIVFLATNELTDVGTKYVAAHKDAAIFKDMDDWDDQGGEAKN